MAKPQVSARLSPEAREMQLALARKLGLSLTAVVEMALRKLAEAEHVVVKAKPKAKAK